MESYVFIYVKWGEAPYQTFLSMTTLMESYVFIMCVKKLQKNN